MQLIIVPRTFLHVSISVESVACHMGSKPRCKNEHVTLYKSIIKYLLSKSSRRPRAPGTKTESILLQSDFSEKEATSERRLARFEGTRMKVTSSP